MYGRRGPDGDLMYGRTDLMYGQSGAEGGPGAYPRQDLTLLCGIPVVRGCAVLQFYFENPRFKDHILTKSLP